MRSSSRATTRILGSATEFGGRWVATAAVVAVAAGFAVSRLTAADSAVQTDQVAGFMRAKLAHSQNVLEGLAVEDFDLLDKGA